MKLSVLDKHGKVLGTRDITGKLWVSAHDGFVNHEDIGMVAVAWGTPNQLRYHDLLGNLISEGTIQCDEFVELGTHMHFASGELAIYMHPIPELKRKKPKLTRKV